MASIILEPGEVFEHYHSEKSTTTLLKGDDVYIHIGELERENTRESLINIGRRMQANTDVAVPSNTPHYLLNDSDNEYAIVQCYH